MTTGRTVQWSTILFCGMLRAPSLSAHEPAIASPYDGWRIWSFEPGIVLGLFISAALYATGLHWLRMRTGAPRKLRAEAGFFWAGWTFLAIALVSPVHPLGQALFAVHMTQHELLMVAAAP